MGWIHVDFCNATNVGIKVNWSFIVPLKFIDIYYLPAMYLLMPEPPGRYIEFNII